MRKMHVQTTLVKVKSPYCGIKWKLTTIPSNKPDIINTSVYRQCNFSRQKCNQARSRPCFRISRPYNKNRAHVERKNKRWYRLTTGATGTISISFRIYLGNMLGKRDITELQETATLGTEIILREVLL